MNDKHWDPANSVISKQAWKKQIQNNNKNGPYSQIAEHQRQRENFGTSTGEAHETFPSSG